MNDFAKERNAAFIDFVRTGNMNKVRKYCRTYGVQMPKDKNVFAAGIYKAVQECIDIPEEIKSLAMQRCLEIGFNPFMKPADMGVEDTEGEAPWS